MLLDVVTGFIQELRRAGVPVSMVEAIDGTTALDHIDLTDRAAFRATLGATLVKSARYQEAFDIAFEIFFADGVAPTVEDALSGQTTPAKGGEGGAGTGETDPALLEALFRALWDQEYGLLRRLSGQAVDQLAGMEPGRPVGGTYYLYRTLRRLDIEGLLERLVGQVPDSEMSELDKRLLREEMQLRVERLRDEIGAEIRRRLVADRGPEAVAKTLRRPLLEEMDLMHATRTDLAKMEQIIQPLTRKMAARLAQQRRRSKGRLDFRKTVRRSLASGGVPLEPQFRAPHPARPEIFLLCDVSGSMATFARFTLQLVHAMANEFSKLRSFAFIDTLDEITGFFPPGVEFGEAVQRISKDAEVVWLDGHSDYSRSFEVFWERHGASLSPRSIVIITGDARNNYRGSNQEALERVAAASRAVFWLNPEPQGYWDTGDSIIGKYRRLCDEVHEVRNLAQLEAFVESVASVSFRHQLHLARPAFRSR